MQCSLGNVLDIDIVIVVVRSRVSRPPLRGHTPQLPHLSHPTHAARSIVHKGLDDSLIPADLPVVVVGHKLPLELEAIRTLGLPLEIAMPRLPDASVVKLSQVTASTTGVLGDHWVEDEGRVMVDEEEEDPRLDRSEMRGGFATSNSDEESSVTFICEISQPTPYCGICACSPGRIRRRDDSSCRPSRIEAREELVHGLVWLRAMYSRTSSRTDRRSVVTRRPKGLAVVRDIAAIEPSFALVIHERNAVADQHVGMGVHSKLSGD